MNILPYSLFWKCKRFCQLKSKYTPPMTSPDATTRNSQVWFYMMGEVSWLIGRMYVYAPKFRMSPQIYLDVLQEELSVLYKIANKLCKIILFWQIQKDNWETGFEVGKCSFQQAHLGNDNNIDKNFKNEQICTFSSK